MLPHCSITETHDLSRRVNELFHDREGAAYDTVHPEIFERERRRWEEVCRLFVSGADQPLVSLDIGCGTGFVGMHLLQYLPIGSTLTCADISKEMLAVCKEKLTPCAQGKTLRFLKMQTEVLDLPDNSVDLVTMNSVLHHMPAYKKLLTEIERVLKPEGIVCIGHEPCSIFFTNSFLRVQAQCLHQLTWKRMAARCLRWCGLYGKVVQSTATKNSMVDAINAVLIQEQRIEHPLTAGDISMLVDIHSPTAGGMRTDEGFNPLTLLNAWNGPSTILFLQTYNHLLKMSDKGTVRRAYGKVLRYFFPLSGSTFFLVARKTLTTNAS